jgi:hypothetical protein
MTGAAFDLWQQAFTLAAMSAGEELQRGMPDALAMALNDTLKAFLSQSNTVDGIGQWATVWGPVVFESRPNGHSYADNAMNVAANADQTVYVVGIAGTNPTSIYDWLREDLGVEHTTSWTAAFPGLQPYGLPDSSSLNPYISASTALGVNNLLHMVDTLQGTNKDLLTFLQSLPVPQTRQATLIFCGHSLAGALSPALALAFFNPAGGRLNLSNWGKVYVYPTAGPTPGNSDFGTFFSSVFRPVGPVTLPYQVWNMNVWNSIDIVPHAWNVALLEKVATLYPASWKMPPLTLTGAIDYAKHRSDTGARTAGGPYQPCANQLLQGTFNSSIPVSDLDSFAKQAIYQHTTAYDVLLNVQSLAPGKRNQAAFMPAVAAFLAGNSAKAR